MTAPVGSTFDLALPPLQLECGAVLGEHRVRGWLAGPDPAEGAQLARGEGAALDPGVRTVLVVHALTGDAEAGGERGWWAPVIGPGRALDPDRVRVLCFNNLGSCYGSSSPDDATFPRVRDIGRDVPTLSMRGALPPANPDDAAPLTTWDQARSIDAALDAVGVERVSLAVGGSVGAMIVLCLAALRPARYARIAPIAGAVAASPWIIAWNHVAERVLALVARGVPAAEALAIARELAMITYRAEPGLALRHGRRGASDPTPAWDPLVPYAVQTWLHHHGEKLAARFSPAAYRAQLGAMSHHDAERDPDGRGRAMLSERLEADVYAVDIDSDALYLPAQTDAIVAVADARGRRTWRRTIRSPHGHDAFLIEWEQLDTLLREALDGAGTER